MMSHSLYDSYGQNRISLQYMYTISNQIKSNMFISCNKVYITTSTILNTITGLVKNWVMRSKHNKQNKTNVTVKLDNACWKSIDSYIETIAVRSCSYPQTLNSQNTAYIQFSLHQGDTITTVEPKKQVHTFIILRLVGVRTYLRGTAWAVPLLEVGRR